MLQFLIDHRIGITQTDGGTFYGITRNIVVTAASSWVCPGFTVPSHPSFLSYYQLVEDAQS